MAEWRFYGRRLELQQLVDIFARNRWFFVKITGRRRIGKTTLVRNAHSTWSSRPIYYVPIPDSGAAGVLSSVTDAMDTFEVPDDRFPRPRTLAELARLVRRCPGRLHRRARRVPVLQSQGVSEFCSLLQAAVDRLSADASHVPGGLVVLGSIHTEMAALLQTARRRFTIGSPIRWSSATSISGRCCRFSATTRTPLRPSAVSLDLVRGRAEVLSRLLRAGGGLAAGAGAPEAGILRELLTAPRPRPTTGSSASFTAGTTRCSSSWLASRRAHRELVSPSVT